MSGHSKWATTKRKKAVIDSKRGKVFTKIIREMTVAAKVGGGNIDANPRLRAVVETAKQVNMPADNIKRAIQKGTGELEGVEYEELVYEGYGPGGVAMLVKVTTDNRNRAAGDIRSIFNKWAGNMGETGSVGWLFTKKGYIVVEKNKADEDELMGVALDAGAEDMKTWESTYEITTRPEDFEKVKKSLETKKIVMTVAEISMIPSNYIKLEGKQARQMLNLMESLEDHDDVQNVYANFDIPDEVMESVSQES